MSDQFDLIEVDDEIAKIIQVGLETVRRYFRHGILFSHDRKNGVAYLSYRGSVQVRYQALRKMRMGPKRIDLGDLGRAFISVSGQEDEFIVSRLKQEIPIEDVVNDFVEQVRNHLRIGP